ncbi:FRAS1-related extracellular matrix protein 2-like [Amphiura filiformis]|uniref:FRAS1-related extracellular matrix protein 2-like n=1 Tax=Amphiura filiformis TaxID=82378 RepID=UPI003B211C80
MTITDNDSKFNLNIATDVVLILDEGSAPRTIDIVREGTIQTKTVEFDVTYDTAQSDDFSITPSSPVTFPPSSSSQPITITINDDDDVEGHESFTLTLRDPKGDDCPNGNRGEDYKLHIKIKDNDGVVNWENTACTAMESDGQCEVCLTRTGDLTDSQTVLISAESNSALIGSDFTDIREIRFAAGAARVCVQVQITPDSIVESTETFTLVITAGQGIDIGSQDTTTVTIIDDDGRVGWEQTSYVFSESAGGSATVHITHSGNSGVAVSVTSSSGRVRPAATSGEDFTPVSISFTIPQQTTRYPLQLQIVNDGVDEPDESFVLTLSAIDSASVTQAETTIIITDDDRTPTSPPPPPPRRGRLILGHQKQRKRLR